MLSMRTDIHPIGRFAPSPTGDLHFGSLVAAVGSYLQAKSSGGDWLVRVEDIDPPREVPGSAERLLSELDRFGMRSDAPVLYQSRRTAAYESALQNLLGSGQAFWCGCSRSDLPASGVYPGTCRNGLPPGKLPRSVRVKAGNSTVRFTDRIQGEVEERLADSTGDFVIWRADGLPAYQLAVVVDDAYQNITEVVRGMDLIGSTARQIHLQNCLKLPRPDYAHLPLAVDSSGDKLSKRLGSDPVSNLPTVRALEQALEFLGQDCETGLEIEQLWEQARRSWSLDRVPKTSSLPVSEVGNRESS
jgi:glutamyl-Q tRNA(Asp) synthetase